MIFDDFWRSTIDIPTGVGIVEDMTNNIFQVPEIAHLMKAWQATVTPTLPRGEVNAHNAWVKAVKEEQIRRGQRKA